MATTAALRKYEADQRRAAIRRVRQFRRWMQSGYDRRYLPDRCPSNADFATARKAGVK